MALTQPKVATCLPPLSFEFFPPRDEELIDRLVSGTACRLGAYAPEFFSITYGADGSSKEGTLRSVAALLEANRNTAPHLSQGSDTDTAIIELINRYLALGVTRLVALKGDARKAGDRRPVYARDLVRTIRQHFGDALRISVAAYPEVHPDTASLDLEMKFFVEKVNAGADEAITQYFYNPEAYANFLDHCARMGLDLPIVPGIMPITNYQGLMRFSERAGADIPRWLDRTLRDKSDNVADLCAFGDEVVTNLCERVIQMGAPRLHFYSLNRWGACSRICDNLGYVKT